MAENNIVIGESEQHYENDWKEWISQGRHKQIISDEKSFLVHGALRKKLETSNKTQDKSEIEIQLEKSELHLRELIKFGNELVNNVKSSHEQHELLRCQEKRGKDVELLENLRRETELSLTQFDEISKKWKDINNLKEPMSIYEDMQTQRENVKNLMASKDELILQCKEELDKMKKKYCEDLDKQAEGICFLVERVDRQIMVLKKSYRASLNGLQNAIEIEKQKILQSSQEKWNNIHHQLLHKEAEKTEKLKEKQQFYAQELEDIWQKQEEISRTTKIRLAKDAEILETEIRKSQANILMNSEKIDYNYQVLQKRNDENVIINNHQKRRVSKLNETIVVLKKKLAEIKCDNELAMEKLTLEIQKLHSGINDLHIKAYHFRTNNSIKVRKIWNINFTEVKRLVSRVLEIDRILYEQQLGRKWNLPNIDFDKLDYVKYFHYIPKTQRKRVKSNSITSSTNRKQLRNILCKISDRGGFLIEDKLLEILAPYTDEEQCVVKIENIFSALNITNIKDVESLIKYFEPYTWCKNCSSASIFTASGSRSCNADNGLVNKSTCKNHTPCIEPGFVLRALNDFMNREMKLLGTSIVTRNINYELPSDLLQIRQADVCSYWQQFASYISKDQQNIWKSIEHGLNHYLEVLKKRAQMDDECVFLQKQNAELKHLLQKL